MGFAISWSVNELVAGDSEERSSLLKVEISWWRLYERVLMSDKIGLFGSLEAGIVFLEGRFKQGAVLLGLDTTDALECNYVFWNFYCPLFAKVVAVGVWFCL